MLNGFQLKRGCIEKKINLSRGKGYFLHPSGEVNHLSAFLWKVVEKRVTFLLKMNSKQQKIGFSKEDYLLPTFLLIFQCFSYSVPSPCRFGGKTLEKLWRDLLWDCKGNGQKVHPIKWEQVTFVQWKQWSGSYQRAEMVELWHRTESSLHHGEDYFAVSNDNERGSSGRGHCRVERHRKEVRESFCSKLKMFGGA